MTGPGANERPGEVGDALPELEKTTSQEQVQAYAEAASDFNPIHIDDEYARTTQFGRRICHGMLILAFVSEMMTSACAIGPSSGIVMSMRASQPAGVIALRRASAPPVSFMVGRPDAKLTTPMSRQNTPDRSPVPSALAQASLAAKRFA